MLLQAHVNLRLNFTLSKCALILRQCNIVFEQLFREFNFEAGRSVLVNSNCCKTKEMWCVVQNWRICSYVSLSS